jgi:YD repeat-containing protein
MYEYDKNGNVIKKDILEISGKNTQTQYEYDTDNRLTKETNQLGKEKTYTYNELSQVVSTTDENGNTTHFKYNFA